MIYQTDPEVLGYALAQYAFTSDNLTEVPQQRLRRLSLTGARLEVFVEAAEILYAHKDFLDQNGLELCAELFYYSTIKGWSSLIMNQRGENIVSALRRDMGEPAPEYGWPSVWSDPDPEVYHRDGVNFKDSIPLTLSLAKDKKWHEAKAKRHSVQFGGTATPNGPLDTDPESQNKVTGAVVMALVLQDGFSVPWTMKDNTVVIMDAAMIIQAGMLVGHHVATCHGVGQVARGHIDSCTTIEQVEAIDLNAYPWPENP